MVLELRELEEEQEEEEEEVTYMEAAGWMGHEEGKCKVYYCKLGSYIMCKITYYVRIRHDKSNMYTLNLRAITAKL